MVLVLKKYYLYFIAIILVIIIIYIIKGKEKKTIVQYTAQSKPIKPLKDWLITSPYGVRAAGFHNGIDLQAPMSTPVLAPIDGVVSWTDSDAGGMQLLLINGEVRLGFAHLSSRQAAHGSTVKQGDIIAHTGNSGTHTSGPHLHYTYSVNGIKQDPQTFHA